MDQNSGNTLPLSEIFGAPRVVFHDSSVGCGLDVCDAGTLAHTRGDTSLKGVSTLATAVLVPLV
ncbi:hypothetical protein ACFP51_13345 [Streptomyces pratens]|uniref:Uncharacterized protein n=1 Tax=Streptomyces pratens TaxID=887456 RepID=A0ABW1LZL0_9ACTN